MANIHRTADLHSMAILCPTVGLWPTWPFPPQQLQVPVVLRVLQGVPAPCLPPAPFAGSVPGFLSSHVQNVPVPRASRAVPWPHPTLTPCHQLGPGGVGEMWTFVRAFFLWVFFS